MSSIRAVLVKRAAAPEVGAFMQKWISGDRIAAGRMDALHEVAFPEAPAEAEG